MSRPLDLDAYFERIAFRGTAAPTLQTLRELHALHTQAIPFDGFSPFLGEEVKLDVHGRLRDVQLVFLRAPQSPLPSSRIFEEKLARLLSRSDK
jgi:hypothetical protein